MSVNNAKKYFDKKSLIEDEYYNTIKNMINCKHCEKILKEPIKCLKYQETFCKKCNVEIKKYKIESMNKFENSLKKLKYLCRNCKNEIKLLDIENHLIEGCNINDNPLIDMIYGENKLVKPTEDEIKKIPKDEMSHITCK